MSLKITELILGECYICDEKIIFVADRLPTALNSLDVKNAAYFKEDGTFICITTGRLFLNDQSKFTVFPKEKYEKMLETFRKFQSDSVKLLQYYYYP